MGDSCIKIHFFGVFYVVVNGWMQKNDRSSQ
jgi:hypothetical protein